MKISDMAVNNIKGNLHRYIMYYLSNSFAVTVFFIFANFIFHPSLNTKNVIDNIIVQRGVTNGLIASQVIIVVFSVLFVGYSTSIFLKSRGKEFGLLSLYGMTKRQIKKYVLIENTIISFLSMGTGILVGVVFSKLFFMVMEAFLDIALPLNISLKAIGLTALVFFCLFEIISIIMLFQIRNKEIIQQLKSNKIPKTIPKFSKFKSILGVLLIVIGYSIAWFVSSDVGVVLVMLPVIFIVVVGTYFIFTQFSIAIANRILKNENMLYKKSNLVSYSQMIYKLQDTAKVLFLAAILGAITFSATETVYSFYTEIPRMSGLNNPQEMAIAQSGKDLNDDSIIKTVKDTLNKNNIKAKEIHEVKGALLYKVKKDGSTSQFFAVSNTDYNKLAKSLGKEKIKVKENELVYNYPYEKSDESSDMGDKGLGWKEIKLNIGEEVKEFKLSQEIYGEVMDLNKVGYFNAIILNDKDFKFALEKVDKNNIVKYNGIRFDDWKDSYKASVEIEEKLNTGENLRYYSKIIPYEEAKKCFGLVLFIGFFISFLFFIASGSIIYFKLFNEIKNDGAEYNILRKIGTTKKEINKIITKQISIIFFLPFVVSTLHSFFALKSLSTLLKGSLFVNGLVVMAGYLVFQVIYFLIIRSIYISQVKYS